MIPLSKILFFVLLIILLVLVALLITSLAGGFNRRDEIQLYNYPVKNYNYSGGRHKSLKYGGAPLNLITVFEYNKDATRANIAGYNTANGLIIDFIFNPKPTFIYGAHCHRSRGTEEIIRALARIPNFNYHFQDSVLLNDGITAYITSIETAFRDLYLIASDANPGGASAIVVTPIISALDVDAVANLHAKMTAVFDNLGGGLFEQLVRAKTTYDAALNTFAPQITICYNKCIEVSTAIAAAAAAPLFIAATDVCNGIELYDSSPLVKDASDNIILPILAEHYASLVAIEAAHINAYNIIGGGGKIVLAPVIGQDATGKFLFNQTDIQTEAAAISASIDTGTNAYITAIELTSHGSSAILKDALDTLASILNINGLNDIIGKITAFKAHDHGGAIAAANADFALLDALSANITNYINDATTQIDRIIIAYKLEFATGKYNTTSGSNDIINSINTYIDEVINGDTTNAGTSLNNADFLVKLNTLDAEIQVNEQNAMFYGLITGVVNLDHIHQLITDIATVIMACNIPFPSIAAYKHALNELNDAIYECYNIFEGATVGSNAEILHQGIYNNAGSGYYHGLYAANDTLEKIIETIGSAPPPYTQTFTHTNTITSSANTILIHMYDGTYPRNIQTIAVTPTDITLLTVGKHYFGYKSGGNYIISYIVRHLINDQVVADATLATYRAADLNNFTIVDSPDNEIDMTTPANIEQIKGILESHEINIYGLSNNLLLYVGDTNTDEYIFWDSIAPAYYAITSISMFNLEVTNTVAAINDKIKFVNTTNKITNAGNINGYAPTAIISMATGVSPETTPYKVFTHKNAANVYEIDNLLFPLFNSRAAAPTIIIPPIITTGMANPIDTTRIKDITYATFSDNLKRENNHNYYHSINDLTAVAAQFANDFVIHNISANGIIQDAAPANINIDGMHRNIYQILFYQPRLDFNNDSAAIYALSDIELAAVGNLNHNYRIHIDNISNPGTIKKESYFGFYDVQAGRHDNYIIKLSDSLAAKQIGSTAGSAVDLFSVYQHNIIYTFERFKENTAADNVIAFNEQMSILPGHILHNAVTETPIPILYYNEPRKQFKIPQDDISNLNKDIFLYDLCCLNDQYVNISIINRGIASQTIFILDTDLPRLDTTVGGAAPPTHVTKYDITFANKFDDNRSYYLYSNNDAPAVAGAALKHRMSESTLLRLCEHSITQATDAATAIGTAVTNTDKYNQFIENIKINLIVDIATVAFFGNITYRYDIRAADSINACVINPDKKAAKADTTLINQYDTMIDNCYHIEDLPLVHILRLNSTIISNDKKIFCSLSHDRGIIYRSANISTEASFSDVKLSNIPFIHGDAATIPSLNDNVDSIIDNTIKLTYKDNFITTYGVINDHLGCSCIGFYNKTKTGDNWHDTGGITYSNVASRTIDIFDDNEHSNNFLTAANVISLTNFEIYSVSMMNIIFYENKPEQKVIFFRDNIVGAPQPIIHHDNCNAIIPLQSDKNNTPFEDTEFYYYFCRKDGGKYYLPYDMCRHMTMPRTPPIANHGINFINLANLRIEHLIQYKATNQLIFRDYAAPIDIVDVQQIIKEYMICEQFDIHSGLFISEPIGNIIDTDRITTTGGTVMELQNIRIPVPRIQPYASTARKYITAPYNNLLAKSADITHSFSVDYMGGTLSFFGTYENILTAMTNPPTGVNSRIFRYYCDNPVYNKMINTVFMTQRPTIYKTDTNAIITNIYPITPLSYIWSNGDFKINLDEFHPLSAYTATDPPTTVSISSSILNLTDIILYNATTPILQSDEALLRIGVLSEPEPVKVIDPEPKLEYIADTKEQHRKLLKKWIEKINMDSGHSHFVNNIGKKINNNSNSLHNNSSATEVATIQIKEIEIIKSKEEYNKIRKNYIKEVNRAKKLGSPIPIPKIYVVPLSKKYLKYKTYSFDNNGNLDFTNIPNGTYYYDGDSIEF